MNALVGIAKACSNPDCKLLAHRYLPPCGAEFSAFGVATVADACIRRDHITFILTNTTDHARRVTVRYEFLGRDIIG